MNSQKRDFIENTSIEELAKYVSEPNLKKHPLDPSIGDYFGPGFMPSVVSNPGDIGTMKTCMINIKNTGKRILFNEQIIGPHEGRFELCKTKLVTQSKHKKSSEVQFDKMAKRMDLFETNKAGLRNRDNARRKRPPSGLIVDYDNAGTKDRTLPKKDKIVPNMSKMLKKDSVFVKSHYYSGTLDIEP